MLLLPLRNPPLVTAAGSHPAGLSQGPDLPVQGVPGTGELSPVLASDSSPQLQHGGTPRVWPLERLLTPHLHGKVPTWGFCSVNKIYHPPTCKEPPTQGAALCPCGSAGYHPWGAVGGISLGSPHTQRCPRRGGLQLAVPSAGLALLTQQRTPCVNARQLLPRPLFAQAASLCLPFGGSRWREMAFRPPANGARQLQAPAPRILQHLRSSSPCPGRCRLLSGCNPSARLKLNPPWNSRSYRKMHPPQHNPAATQPGKLFIIISLQQRYGKKAPALPR